MSNDRSFHLGVRVEPFNEHETKASPQGGALSDLLGLGGASVSVWAVLRYLLEYIFKMMLLRNASIATLLSSITLLPFTGIDALELAFDDLAHSCASSTEIHPAKSASEDAPSSAITVSVTSRRSAIPVGMPRQYSDCGETRTRRCIPRPNEDGSPTDTSR